MSAGTKFFEAIQANNYEVAQTLFFEAVQANDHEEVQTFLSNKLISVDERNKNGDPALIAAVKCNAVEVAHVLLLNGADVDMSDNQLQTPLHWAVIRQNELMVELLL